MFLSCSARKMNYSVIQLRFRGVDIRIKMTQESEGKSSLGTRPFAWRKGLAKRTSTVRAKGMQLFYYSRSSGPVPNLQNWNGVVIDLPL